MIGGTMFIFANLSDSQKEALRMRFAENRTIFDVARRLKVSWEDANLIIESALQELRHQVKKGVA
jgi:DNA-directed RNA polymerase specialized sigma subunit